MYDKVEKEAAFSESKGHFFFQLTNSFYMAMSSTFLDHIHVEIHRNAKDTYLAKNSLISFYKLY